MWFGSQSKVSIPCALPHAAVMATTFLHYAEPPSFCRLRFPRLPCLNVGRPNKEIWLPLEVCHITRGQRRMKLDERQQAAMVSTAAQEPKARLQWIQECVTKHAKLDQDPSVKAFGMGVANTLSAVGSHAMQGCMWLHGAMEVSVLARCCEADQVA